MMKTVALFLLLAGVLVTYILAEESLPGEIVNTELTEDDKAWERSVIPEIDERALKGKLSAKDDVNVADKHVDVTRRRLRCGRGGCSYCKFRACIAARRRGSNAVQITISFGRSIIWRRIIRLRRGRRSFTIRIGSRYILRVTIDLRRRRFCAVLRIRLGRFRFWRRLRWRYITVAKCFRL